MSEAGGGWYYPDSAEETPPFPYDPDNDNCAGVGHGDERVFYRWFGIDQTCCPRCYTVIYAEPDSSEVFTVPGGAA